MCVCVSRGVKRRSVFVDIGDAILSAIREERRQPIGRMKRKGTPPSISIRAASATVDVSENSCNANTFTYGTCSADSTFASTTDEPIHRSEWVP